MCYCTPEVRTPFCSNCNTVMFKDINTLHSIIDALMFKFCPEQMTEVWENKQKIILKDNGGKVNT